MSSVIRESSRRGFLTGLAAAFAAPAIIRPGLLMPIKPSLMPNWRLKQLGVDYIEQSGVREKAYGALIREIESQGLTIIREPMPMPAGVMGGAFNGPFREIPFYSGKDVWRHVDVWCRDYST